MTTASPTTPTEEFDFPRIIQSLLRHKWLIVFGSIAFGAVGYGASFLVAPTYEAVSHVVVVDVRFPVEGSPGSHAQLTRVEPSYESLHGLAKDGTIVAAVAQRLKGVPGAPQSESAVSAAMTPRLYGSTYGLAFQSADAQSAARGADAWAEAFVDHVDRLYAQTVSDSLVQSLQPEFDRARAECDKAGEAWVRAVGESTLVRLELESRSKQAARDAWADAATARLASAHAEHLRLEGIQSRLAALVGEIRASDGHLTALRAALILLKTEVFAQGAAVQIPVDSAVDSSADGAADLLKEASQLSNMLDDRIKRVGEWLASFEESSNTGPIEALEKEIRDLHRQIAEQKGREDRVAVAYAAAKTALERISLKLQETRGASTYRTIDATVASPALKPESPVGPRPGLNATVAACFGLALFTFAALVRGALR